MGHDGLRVGCNAVSPKGNPMKNNKGASVGWEKP